MDAGVKVPESLLKTFLKSDISQVLPRRLDWLGNEHPQSYDDLVSFSVIFCEKTVFVYVFG